MGSRLSFLFDEDCRPQVESATNKTIISKMMSVFGKKDNKGIDQMLRSYFILEYIVYTILHTNNKAVL